MSETDNFLPNFVCNDKETAFLIMTGMHVLAAQELKIAEQARLNRESEAAEHHMSVVHKCMTLADLALKEYNLIADPV